MVALRRSLFIATTNWPIFSWNFAVNPSFRSQLMILFCGAEQYLIRDYEKQQHRAIGTKALSRMLSTRLYYRRSFPFYTFNIVGGLDERGELMSETAYEPIAIFDTNIHSFRSDLFFLESFLQFHHTLLCIVASLHPMRRPSRHGE